MQLGIVLAVFPLIFFGELPDKTMFASLILASRGRPLAVWFGAALAFVVHVVIAVSIGVGLFHLLPHRAVDALVAVLFAVGAVLAFRGVRRGRGASAPRRSSRRPRCACTARSRTAFLVIFLAEWGDLTQVLTANLAAALPLAAQRRARRDCSRSGRSPRSRRSAAARSCASCPGLLLRRITGVACAVLAVVASSRTIRG